MLGLGEAGAALAADLLDAGARVIGFDPRAGAGKAIPRADSAAAAVADADVVLSVNAAEVAAGVARSVVESLSAEQLYADLNSAGAPLKRELAELIEPSGALFADVALMAPVPGHGLRTPSLVSGSGAERFAGTIGALGMPVEVVGAEPGQAAVRKLLRSVFMKGIAAAAIEALSAAAAAGCEDWLREEIAGVLDGADAALLERLETGSRKHAARRVHEVQDASALLRELGIEPRVSEASEGWLTQLRDGGATP